MAKKQPKQRLRCVVCHAPAASTSELGDHCLKTGHQAQHCCQQCVRWFISEAALRQHNLSKHESEILPLPHHIEPEIAQIATSTPGSRSDCFTDQNYRCVALIDLETIYSRLISKCHSYERLRKQAFIMPTDLGDINTHKKQSKAFNDTTVAPSPTPFFPKRKAIVLDCEMAGVRDGNSEIVSICVVDLFSGQVLMDTFVRPREQIVDWRTNIHDIRPSTLSIAAVQGKVLDGWETARQELFQHINTDTVMIGHSIQNDLKALRLSHATVVDTAILTSDAVYGTGSHSGRCWGLESLCADLLKLRIRQSKTHSALEDAMAAREVVLWCICYPEKLNNWANRAKAGWRENKAQKPKRVKNKWQGTGRTKVSASSYVQNSADPFDSDDEILRWDDVVDWETWPKSPPCSD
ncbi:hypothetical protein FGRMN_6241 [Fusarium graminum]|nr:hypothetical protein FGRMN_6241 [Fusarium graminum]